MDPMTLLALLQAGGSLMQGAFGAAGAQQENRMNQAMQRRRAARLGDVARMLEGMDSMARLPQAYSRALSGSVGASRASAAMRGLGNSGVQGEMEARMQGEALAALAAQVNESEQQRLALLGELYSDPAFGALNEDELPNANGLIALQGLLGAGMSLAPLLGGGGGQSAGMTNPFEGMAPQAATPYTGPQYTQRGMTRGVATTPPATGRSMQNPMQTPVPSYTYQPTSRFGQYPVR